MKTAIAILLLAVSLQSASALSLCPGKIKPGSQDCVCTETISPKAITGYGLSAEIVNIVCINNETMDVAYYTRNRDDTGGGKYSSDPFSH